MRWKIYTFEWFFEFTLDLPQVTPFPLLVYTILIIKGYLLHKPFCLLAYTLFLTSQNLFDFRDRSQKKWAFFKIQKELPMKTAELHQQDRLVDFIVKLKKKTKSKPFLLFYVWISEFCMVGNFLKICYLNR